MKSFNMKEAAASNRGLFFQFTSVRDAQGRKMASSGSFPASNSPYRGIDILEL
jgi:hypothetical protein